MTIVVKVYIFENLKGLINMQRIKNVYETKKGIVTFNVLGKPLTRNARISFDKEGKALYAEPYDDEGTYGITTQFDIKLVVDGATPLPDYSVKEAETFLAENESYFTDASLQENVSNILRRIRHEEDKLLEPTTDMLDRDISRICLKALHSRLNDNLRLLKVGV